MENYRAFFDAIRRVYPHMQLIANCDLRGDQAPVQEFDWHIYTSQWDLLNPQHEFDNMVPGADPLVFASEYAVTADGGWGNLKVSRGARSMTGVEDDCLLLEAYVAGMQAACKPTGIIMQPVADAKCLYEATAGQVGGRRCWDIVKWWQLLSTCFVPSSTSFDEGLTHL